MAPRVLVPLLALALVPGCLSALLGTENTPAPAFSLRTLEGRNVTLDSFGGNVLLLDFMATTCEPCKSVSSSLARLLREEAGVSVLSVSITNDPDEQRALEAWQSTRNLSWDHALDTDRTFLRYEGKIIPYLVVVDASGVIRDRASGDTSFSEMLAMVRTAKVAQ